MTEVIEDPRILLYTRIRKSPFFYASRRHSVPVYSVYNHAYHPRHYGDPVEEYWKLVNGVTPWDVGVERQIQGWGHGRVGNESGAPVRRSRGVH